MAAQPGDEAEIVEHGGVEVGGEAARPADDAVDDGAGGVQSGEGGGLAGDRGGGGFEGEAERGEVLADGVMEIVGEAAAFGILGGGDTCGEVAEGVFGLLAGGDSGLQTGGAGGDESFDFAGEPAAGGEEGDDDEHQSAADGGVPIEDGRIQRVGAGQVDGEPQEGDRDGEEVAGAAADEPGEEAQGKDVKDGHGDVGSGDPVEAGGREKVENGDGQKPPAGETGRRTLEKEGTRDTAESFFALTVCRGRRPRAAADPGAGRGKREYSTRSRAGRVVERGGDGGWIGRGGRGGFGAELSSSSRSATISGVGVSWCGRWNDRRRRRGDCAEE